jgi:nitric oxide reductase NorQ protein
MRKPPVQHELKVLKPEEYFITDEPYYETVGEEIAVFEAAYRNGLPVLLKGPTGCGKTRFMEHMAWRLKRPLITVSCHDDLTSSDLVGRFLVKGGETIWVDGPLARAVRAGGICYLDEVVEARRTPRSSSTRSPTTAACCRWRSSANCWRPLTPSAWPSPTTPATNRC